MPLVARFVRLLDVDLLCESRVVHLVDVAVLDREPLATAVDLHRVAVAHCPLAPEDALRLDRAPYPAELAVRDAKPLYRARADSVGADVLDAEVVYVHIVCTAHRDAVLLHVELDRLESLARILH